MLQQGNFKQSLDIIAEKPKRLHQKAHGSRKDLKNNKYPLNDENIDIGVIPIPY